MRRRIGLLLLLLILAVQTAPYAVAAEPVVQIVDYTPFPSLEVSGVEVKALNTVYIKEENGSLFVTTSRALVNQTITLSGNETILPHLYTAYFNGTQYVYETTFNTTSGFSAEACVKPIAFIKNGDEYWNGRLMGVKDGYFGNGGWHIELRSGVYRVMYRNSTTYESLSASISFDQRTINKYQCYGIVYNGNAWNLYLNRTLLLSNTSTVKMIATSLVFGLMHSPAGDSYIKGYLRYGFIKPSLGLINETILTNDTFIYDPTWFNGTHFLDPIHRSTWTTVGGEITRILDNVTWFWVVEDAYSDGLVHFGWAPDGYAFYVYDLDGNLVGIYRNNETASLNGTYRILLAPAPPEDTTIPYGGILVGGLEPDAVVEAWSSSGARFVAKADNDGIALLTVPEGVYTVRVYPPSYMEYNAVIELNLTISTEYVYINLTDLLASQGLDTSLLPEQVDNTTSWGYSSNGTLYLYKPGETITIYLKYDVTPPPPPELTITEAYTSYDILNGTVENASLIAAAGTEIYTAGTGNGAYAYRIFTTIDPSNYRVNYTIKKSTNNYYGIEGAIIGVDGNWLYWVGLGDYNNVTVGIYDVTTHGVEILHDEGTIVGLNSWTTFTVINGDIYWNGKFLYHISVTPAVGILTTGDEIHLETPVTAYSGPPLSEANYTVIGVKTRLADFSINVTPVVTEWPLIVAVNYTSQYYAYIRVEANNTVLYIGPPANMTIEVYNLSDGLYNVLLEILDPYTLGVSETLSAWADVDVMPPELTAYVVALMPGTTSILVHVDASGYETLTATLNGTPVAIRPGDNVITLPRLKEWYTLVITAVDRYNRATIATLTFYANPPTEIQPLDPGAAAGGISGFLKVFIENPLDYSISFIDFYSWGLFLPALAGVLMMSLYLKTYSVGMAAAAALLLAFLLGQPWLAVVGVVGVTVVYTIWKRSKG